jgi:hypothetical protein
MSRVKISLATTREPGKLGSESIVPETAVSPKTKAALPYLVAGFVALLFVVIIGSFITKNIRVLVTSDLGNGAYYILLVVVSLASLALSWP